MAEYLDGGQDHTPPTEGQPGVASAIGLEGEPGGQSGQRCAGGGVDVEPVEKVACNSGGLGEAPRAAQHDRFSTSEAHP